MRFLLRALLIVVGCISAHGCVPVEAGDDRLVGTWHVEWTCGKETVDLRRDKSYEQRIEYAAGGRANHSGIWRTKPKPSQLEGSHVVLQDAMTFCTPFGERLSMPQRGDRELETIWEWGRLTLSFNPDLPGFAR